MFFEAIIIGIIFGWTKKGRLSNLSEINFKYYYLILISVMIQILPFFIENQNLIKNYKYLSIISLIIVIVFVVLNLNKNGFFVVLLGTICHLIGYIINNFKVPVLININSSEKLLNLKFLIDINEIPNYKTYYEFENVNQYFGKIFIMPEWYPLTKYFSIGDVLVFIGIVLFIKNQMIIHKKSSFVRYRE